MEASVPKSVPKKKKIVVKIGSSLLAHDENLTLRYAFINGLLSDLAQIKKDGYDVILTRPDQLLWV